MKRGYIEIPEVLQIHYRTEGSGEVILLLHQTPYSSDEYSDVIPFLAQGYRAIAIDTVGHGNSEIPPREYEIEDFGRAVIGVLNTLGIDRTNLVGHHTGAHIAVEVAAKNPNRVHKLILSGLAPLDFKGWEEFWANTRREGPPPAGITDDGQFILNTWNGYQKWAPNTPAATKIRPLVLSLIQRTRPYNAHQAVDRHPTTALMPLIKCPTLLISGDRDLFYHTLDRTQSLIPGSKTLVIKDTGVLIGWERPQEFAQAILDFMAQPGD